MCLGNTAKNHSIKWNKIKHSFLNLGGGEKARNMIAVHECGRWWTIWLIIASFKAPETAAQTKRRKWIICVFFFKRISPQNKSPGFVRIWFALLEVKKWSLCSKWVTKTRKWSSENWSQKYILYQQKYDSTHSCFFTFFSTWCYKRNKFQVYKINPSLNIG